MRFSLARMTDILQLIKELENGLRKLTFAENFQATVMDVTFLPGEEKQLPHNLQLIPSSYIILRQDAPGQIIDGTIDWDDESIYLLNTSQNTINTKISIMR